MWPCDTQCGDAVQWEQQIQLLEVIVFVSSSHRYGGRSRCNYKQVSALLAHSSTTNTSTVSFQIKGIEYEYEAVNLLKKEQLTDKCVGEREREMNRDCVSS